MNTSIVQKKYHLIVLGCQMNKSDGERIEHVLNLMGFEKADSEEDANLFCVISCSVRQTAMDRIHGKIHQWNEVKKQRPIITMLTGCVLPYDREQVAQKFDIFFEMNDLPKLPQYISQIPGFEMMNESTASLAEYSDYFQVQPKYHEIFRAYVPIMTGCNKFCTYCAVPYTRGRERSRSVREIMDEIQSLVDQGCLEVVLLGQNVNSYHPEDTSNFSGFNPYHDPFAALLWELNQIPSLNRIHYTAPHPNDMNEEAVDALTLPKHVRYLHLPMQSGDNEILKKMNRKYSIEKYLELVGNIREKIPDIAFGTDIIVGFCGETEDQFQRTVDAYKQVGFDISYHALYSSRPGTSADRVWKDDVVRQEKKRRWQVLQDLMKEITFSKNQRFVGHEVEVLGEKYKNGFCFGNTREYKMAKFSGTVEDVGKIHHVRVQKAMTWVLEGEKIL